MLLDHGARSLDDPAYPQSPVSLGDELLRPSVIYAPGVLEVAAAVDVKAIAHVTGGGLASNLTRVILDRTKTPDDAVLITVDSDLEDPFDANHDFGGEIL